MGGQRIRRSGVHAYTEGSVVDVTATPNSGYVFDHWSGACTGSGACQVTHGLRTKSVTAHFVAGTAYDLTIARIRPAAAPPSLRSGSTAMRQARLSPSPLRPLPGMCSTGWGGACTGTGCCTVTMDADKTVTANFTVAVSHIADIGSNTIKDSGNANLVVTTTAAVAAGDDIVIAYATDPTQDLTITVSDSAGNKYQQAAHGASAQAICARTSLRPTMLPLCPAAAPSPSTRRLYSSTAVAARAAVVSVFRGLAPVGALEQTSAGSPAPARRHPPGAATTVQPVQLLIGAVGHGRPER